MFTKSAHCITNILGKCVEFIARALGWGRWLSLRVTDSSLLCLTKHKAGTTLQNLKQRLNIFYIFEIISLQQYAKCFSCTTNLLAAIKFHQM